MITHDLNTIAVEYRNVAKSYGSFKAVNDVSFSVAKGEFTTLLGPSGSGKSTLLSMAAGAAVPDSGKIIFNGTDVTKVAPHQRNIGMVFQRYTLFPNKTVSENIAFPLKIRKLSREVIAQKVQAALQMVDLTAQAGRYPSQISGGQAQRVAVARALVFEPSLLLMDEPLGALDKSLRDLLQIEIRRIQRLTGVPTLYVTHDQDEAMNMSDRIIIMRKGQIAANGRPRDLYEHPTSLWAAQFLGEVNALPVHATSRDGAGIIATLSAGVRAPAIQKTSFDPGAALVAVLRPERCHIARRQEDKPSIKAKVTNVTYLGSRQRVEGQAEDGQILRAVLPGHVESAIEGEDVYFSWDDGVLMLLENDVSGGNETDFVPQGRAE